MKRYFTLALLLSARLLSAQTTTSYEAQAGACSYRLSLYPDQSYTYSTDCTGGAATVSFGRFTSKKDTLKLQPLDNLHYPVVANMTATKIESGQISVTIWDKNGVNITDKISIALFVSGRGSYMFESDSARTAKSVYKRDKGVMVIRTLNRVFGQAFEFATDTANRFEFHLNIPSEWITNKRVEWAGPSPLKLLKRKEQLIGYGPGFPSSLLFHKE